MIIQLNQKRQYELALEEWLDRDYFELRRKNNGAMSPILTFDTKSRELVIYFPKFEFIGETKFWKKYKVKEVTQKGQV